MSDLQHTLARHAAADVELLCASVRAVLVVGARQTGKTTLARGIAAGGFGAGTGPVPIVTLDDATVRAAAGRDAAGFLAQLGMPAVIDEVQRAPELILAIKQRLDEDTRPGRYLLTGSAQLRGVSGVLDLLPGRIVTVPLWPLAQSEIAGTPPSIVASLFENMPPRIEAAPVGRSAYAAAIAAGGFPEARLLPQAVRARWFDAYVGGVLLGETERLGGGSALTSLPRLLTLLAARTGVPLSVDALATRVELDRRTILRYLDILEILSITTRLPAWTPGLSRREIHAPKVVLNDSGLFCSLLGFDEARLAIDDEATGKAFETFALGEILRHASLLQSGAPRAFHYRDQSRRLGEVDLLLEARSGEIVAIEAKSSATVSERDAVALASLRDRAGASFRCGVVLTTGASTIPLGDRLWAVPLQALWSQTANAPA